MKIMTQILDKLLTSLVTSFLLFFCSFSFMTGKFPPQKADFKKATSLLQQMFSSTQEYNEANKAMSGHTPNMEQIVQLQRLALRRSEVSLEMTKMMVRFPKGVPSLEMAEKLERATVALNQADQALNDANQDLQKMSNTMSEEAQ
jgi:hypothetical protein